MSPARRGPRGTVWPPRPQAEPAEGSWRHVNLAWRSAYSLLLFLAVVALGVWADLASKRAVFDRLANAPHRSYTLIPDVLRFTLSTNPGIVFGLRVPGWLVMLATIAAAATVVILFATSSRRRWMLHAALGMVLGGSLGNAYDRLFSRVKFADDAAPRTGQVRDFVDVYVINYPIFNVADILLVVGVLLIMLQVLSHRKDQPQQI